MLGQQEWVPPTTFAMPDFTDHLYALTPTETPFNYTQLYQGPLVTLTPDTHPEAESFNAEIQRSLADWNWTPDVTADEVTKRRDRILAQWEKDQEQFDAFQRRLFPGGRTADQGIIDYIEP